MKVLVIGAGGVGAFVGGRLALFGQEVTLVNRSPAFLARVKERGLLVEERGEVAAVPQIRAVTTVEETAAAGYDLVLFTVKGYDTRAALDQAGGVLAERRWPLLTLQNGVGNEELLAERLGAEKVISGALTMPVTVVEPGWVRLEPSRGGIGLAAVAGGDDRNGWTGLFRQCGFATRWYPDYRSLKWSKLLLNLVANAIPAILDLPPGEAYRRRDLFLLEREMLAEAVAAVRLLGIPMVDLPGYPVPLLFTLLLSLPVSLAHPWFQRKIGRERGEKLPSLLLDLQARKGRTEAATLNGAVVDVARRLGCPSPLNETLVGILDQLAAGTENRFSRRPDRLLETVRDKTGVTTG